MKIILLGTPGSGKGTQAKKICEKFSIVSISTGEIIRNALKSGTKQGLEAKKYIDKGALVPDDVVIGIVWERIQQDDCKNGFILDGFPRTIPQAEALERMNVGIDAVVCLNVPDEAIVTRMSGRRVCTNCGTGYHMMFNRPIQEGICDVCGNTLSQRDDDKPETVQERLKVYHENTEPLIDFYKNKGLLVEIEALKEIDLVTEDIVKALEAVK
ncbi:MAG: adenylate kinase [Clostridia bacterium]|nr:adenylate kinase [Clostridia bacterium]